MRTVGECFGLELNFVFLGSCFHDSASLLHHRFPSGFTGHLVHSILSIPNSFCGPSCEHGNSPCVMALCRRAGCAPTEQGDYSLRFDKSNAIRATL